MSPSNWETVPSATSSNRSDERRAAAARRAELAPLKQSIAAAEARLADLSRDLDRIDKALSHGHLYTEDPAKAEALARERGSVLKAISQTEEAWYEANEAYENATLAAGE